MKTKNLIQMNQTRKNNSNNIRILTINVRSVKNKQQQIVITTGLENIDFIMLMETWLKNTDEDKAWINISDLNNNNLRIDTVSRSSKGNMYTKFLKEVSKLTQLLMTNYTNLVLVGDFNIHTQDMENPDSITYNDMMEALGLQHIDKQTHIL